MIGILLLLVSASVAWFIIVLTGSSPYKRIKMTLACLVPALVLFIPSWWGWAKGVPDAHYGFVMAVIVFGFCVTINLTILLIWWIVRRLRGRHS